MSFRFGKVQKAKTPKSGKKVMDKARRIRAIADAMETAAIGNVLRGITRFKREVKGDEVIEALDKRERDKVMETIPFERLPEDLKPLVAQQEVAWVQSTTLATVTMASPPARFILGTANPRVSRFINANVGALVREIEFDTRRSVAAAVTRGLDEARNPRQIAQDIRQVVGLTEKQTERALAARAREVAKRVDLDSKLALLKAEGKGNTKTAARIRVQRSALTPKVIERRHAIRIRRAEKQRAVTIARTELTRAVNQGQLDVWEEAADQGLIDRNTVVKRWVVVDDAVLSSICADLDGETQPLDGFFTTNTGNQVQRPPAHPNCRSAVVLEEADDDS